ncbi:hypothetical protein MAP00_006909 [Monascus purpureus]|nr:hypothetical protein MAP00_006909 [Monascus purpureus]
MSDALCGPSNALQNFQKHTSVDRTLQQDRLTSRQSPSQNFRSLNPNAGALDPEFAAFETTSAGPVLPDIQHATPFLPHNTRLSMTGHAGNSDWTADFQNLQISGPSHSNPQFQRPSAAPISTAAPGGWQHEFLQHQQRNLTTQLLQPYNHAFQPSFAPSFPSHASAADLVHPSQEVAGERQAPTEAFDESAFEAAFEQARADLELQANETTQEEVNTARESIQVGAPQTETGEQIKIGSDTIPYANKEDQASSANEADELARTAGQLLESVSHDQSQKFKDSNFLALMRRIRDREVQVEGDEFRETAQPLHPGGRNYPDEHRAPRPGHEKHEFGITAADIT